MNTSLQIPTPFAAALPFAQLFRETLEALVLVDGRGEIQLFSRGAERLLGYCAEDVIGKRARSLFVKGAYEVRQLLLQLDRQGFLQNYETQVYRSDRSTLSLRLSLTRARQEHGRASGFLILLSDDLPSRQAELQLRRREEELEHFVYVISHNLKTPIISIQGFANLLREELGAHLGAEHLHFLDRIQKNAVLMEKMILDLLEFSRLGRELPRLGEFELAELLREVIDEMRLLEQIAKKQDHAEARAVSRAAQAPAEFVLPDSLPRLWADANGLKNVFQNLFSNALKYRRPEAPLRLEVGWQELPRFHALWVRDNGLGMEPLFQKKAFDLFQRGPQVGHIPGTGVGLAVVRRIVEKHHGLVRLDSKLGEGTTVYFTIPKPEQKTA
ncbi:MAG: ATP-binding protein [candidate division KSB1 bacterium]